MSLDDTELTLGVLRPCEGFVSDLELAHTMPGILDEPDEYGFPMRHWPVHRLGPIWVCKCGSIAYEFHPVSFVMDQCLPCLGCYPGRIS